MPINFTVLQAFVNNTNDQSAYTTAASYTPEANSVVFLNIGIKQLSGTAALVTGVSGGGITTWTELVTLNPETRRRQSVWYGLAGASPGTAQITVTLEGTLTSCQIQLIEVTGTKITGTNGVDSIVQIKSATKGSTANLPITFDSAWDNEDNIALGLYYANNASAAWTPGTGFTELDDNGTGSGDNSGNLMAVYGRNGDTLTIDGTTTDTGIKSGVIIELAIASGLIPIVQRSAFATRRFNGRLI